VNFSNELGVSVSPAFSFTRSQCGQVYFHILGKCSAGHMDSARVDG